MSSDNRIHGYLPDERPPILELIVFALQQIVVMFPATVLVALITHFHVSTTIFASGLATLCFILITGRKIPLYYGSSFSYITAISSIMGSQEIISTYSPDQLNSHIAVAQFGIVMSGFVSIIAGLIVKRFGQKEIEKVLPPTVTGSIAMVIGLTLAGNAMTNASGASIKLTGYASNMSWVIAIVTLFSTILYSVYLKGKLSQLPILFGLLTGYATALIIDLCTGLNFVSFTSIDQFENLGQGIFHLPVITFPKPSWMAVAAIMPIAIATIPESTAHIFQLDIYVNNLAKLKKTKKEYNIKDKLGLNLIGDGIGDIISGFFGGPAGTNYGENLSTMAISKNFSIPVLMAAAIITMIISCFTPLIRAVYSIPTAVIGGLSIYLFGIIAAQGIAIMIERQVDLFSAKNLATIAIILVIGIGGSYSFPNGMIPMFGVQFPAIATAAVVGIVLNVLLSIKQKEAVVETEEEEAAEEVVK